MRVKGLAAVMAIATVLFAAPAPAEGAKPPEDARVEGQIAITIDDLPSLTLITDQAYVNRTNAELLEGLVRHHVPAIGFVNEGKIYELKPAQQIAILRRWLAAGMQLGNHTYSHEGPNDVGAKGYTADILKGEKITRPLLARAHQKLEWFRHPYLETGSPEAERDEIDHWLGAHHYRVAPVTIDADDWEFAEPYDDAIVHHNTAEAEEVRRQYLEHTRQMIAWYRAASHSLFGREIAFVMLMHDTRLNGDCWDEFMAILKEERLTPVPLAQAMADPAYQTADHYAGKDGIEWMERWSATLHKDLPWDSYRDPPADVQAEYDRIDPGGR